MRPYRYSPRTLICGTLTLLACAPSIASEPKPELEAFQKGKACLEKADYDAAIADFTEAINSIRNSPGRIATAASPTGAGR